MLLLGLAFSKIRYFARCHLCARGSFQFSIYVKKKSVSVREDFFRFYKIFTPYIFIHRDRIFSTFFTPCLKREDFSTLQGDSRTDPALSSDCNTIELLNNDS